MSDGWLDPMPAPLPLALRRGRRGLPFPLEDPRCRVCDLGRNALWIGLRQLGLGRGDELLMPAYHCGTDVGPAVDLGIVPRFWSGNEDLEPDERELEGLLGPRSRGLYLIHHLGFAQDSPRWSRWCRERGLLLIEDVAPSWLAGRDGKPLGSWGDLSIFSPWKTLGLPEGAALICQSPPPPLPLAPGAPLTEIAKSLARWPLQRSRPLSELRQRRRERHMRSEESADPAALGPRRPERGISRTGLALMRLLADPRIAERRRRHFEWLRARIGHRFAPPFDRDPGEGCPAGAPIFAEDKRGLIAHLAKLNIEGVDFWPLPHPATPAGAFPEIDRRRATTVLLPVHQGLRNRDLERIASAVAEWSG